MTVLRKTILVRRASPRQINVVDLGDEAGQGPWSDVDLLAVIRSACRVNVEAGQNFANRLVDSKDNLELLS
jgi:hypothetical protein